MKKSLFTHLLCFFIIIFCVQCSGLTVDVPDSDANTNLNQEEPSDTNTDPNLDGDPSTGGSSTTVGNPANDGTEEIPAPTASSFLVAKQDAATDTVGFGSIDSYDGPYGTGVENVTTGGRLQTEQNTFLAKLSDMARDFSTALTAFAPVEMTMFLLVFSYW